jgi:tRNA (guanine26-N2/guanine27-N2)-dimethyltransferase
VDLFQTKTTASGLRAIRYAKEVDGLGEIIANDIDPIAVAAIQRNIKFNNVSSVVSENHVSITANKADAT